GSGGGTFTIAASGAMTFDPGSAFDDLPTGQTRSTRVTYTISDGEGGSDTATVTVTVTGENDPPTPVGTIPDQTNEDADTLVSVDISGNFADVDGGAVLSYTAVNLPAGLSLDLNSGVISGTLDRSASQGGTGGVYSVTVTADDGDATTTQTSFTWTVTNPVPDARDNDYGTTENSSTSGNVLTDNDATAGLDSDPDGDPLAVSEVNGQSADVGQPVTGSAGGTFTIAASGAMTFDPGSAFDDLPAGQTRSTSVTYTITDNEGGSDTATATVTVTGENDPPTPVGTIPDQSNEDADTIVSVDVSGNFTDVDDPDTLTFSISGQPAGLTIDPNTGVISGTLDRSASQGGTDGVYSVTVTADDGDATTTQT
ncbi:MAG: hemolysin, partial [Acidimicrobiaceae bacterium]